MKKRITLPVLCLLGCIFAAALATKVSAAPAISAKKAGITVGNTMSLKVRKAKGKVAWKSSNPSVAKVNARGVVTALKRGSATVTAKVARNKKKLSCKVTVKAAKLNASSISLYIGRSKVLKFTNSKGKVLWSSSDKSVAQVTSSGKVKGIKAGKAIIRAKIGASAYQCRVTVKNPDVAAESLEFQVEGGGDFVRGSSSAGIQFSMKRDAYNVVLQVVDSLGKEVYEEVYDICREKQVYSLTWTPSDTIAVGSYRVLLKAGAEETYSPYLSLKKSGVFAGGNGSEETPYLVSTLEQFRAVELNNGFCYKQINDIDGGQAMISGIYSVENPFTGSYDGGGFAIRNFILKDSTMKAMALFGGVSESGVLENIRLENIDMIGGYNNASLLSIQNMGVISNCSVSNCTINNTYNDGNSEFSFLCSWNEENGRISSCAVKSCSASINGKEGTVWSGGLVVDNHGKLLDCTAEESSIFVKMSSYNYSSSYLSGIARWNNGHMQNCSASGVTLDSVSGGINHRNETTGGICQLNEGVIRSCSFSGSAINTGVETNKGLVS